MAQRRTANARQSGFSSFWLIGGAGLLILILAVGGVIVWLRSPQAVGPPPGVLDVTPEGFPVLGAPTAPVTVIEYADFQCANCRRFTEESLPAFDPYIRSGLVRLVFHDFPIRGAESILASEAGRCALEQNAFWPYHDLLYDRQSGINEGTFTEANLEAYAAELGLDVPAFGRCLASRKYRGAVRAALADAQALGLQGTPSFVLQDPVATREPLAGDPGPQQWDDLFQRYIDDLGLRSP